MTPDMLIMACVLSGISGVLLTCLIVICELARCRRDATIVSYYALACFAVFTLSLARLTHVI